MARKVFSLYGRNGYSGSWTFLNWFSGKREASAASDRARYQWTERKVLAEFDYEAKARAAGARDRARRDPKQLRMFGEAGHGQLDLYMSADPDVSIFYLDRGMRTLVRLRRSEARAFLKQLPKGAWTRETRKVARELGVR